MPGALIRERVSALNCPIGEIADKDWAKILAPYSGPPGGSTLVRYRGRDYAGPVHLLSCVKEVLTKPPSLYQLFERISQALKRPRHYSDNDWDFVLRPTTIDPKTIPYIRYRQKQFWNFHALVSHLKIDPDDMAIDFKGEVVVPEDCASNNLFTPPPEHSVCCSFTETPLRKMAFPDGQWRVLVPIVIEGFGFRSIEELERFYGLRLDKALRNLCCDHIPLPELLSTKVIKAVMRKSAPLYHPYYNGVVQPIYSLYQGSALNTAEFQWLKTHRDRLRFYRPNCEHYLLDPPPAITDLREA